MKREGWGECERRQPGWLTSPLCEDNGDHEAAERHGGPAPSARERSRWLSVDQMWLRLECDQSILGH